MFNKSQGLGKTLKITLDQRLIIKFNVNDDFDSLLHKVTHSINKKGFVLRLKSLSLEGRSLDMTRDNKIYGGNESYEYRL